MEKQTKPLVSTEQLAYATTLDVGVKIGFTILVLSFSFYLFEWVSTHLPKEELPDYWSLSVTEYLAATQLEPGWSWLSLLHKSDFLNFIGIAFLSMISMVCYLRILPILIKQNDIIYSIIVILEILILALAASGLLVPDH